MTRRDPVLLQHLRQDLLLPAVLPQAHALPHGREAPLVLCVWPVLQGALNSTEPREDPQR